MGRLGPWAPTAQHLGEEAGTGRGAALTCTQPPRQLWQLCRGHAASSGNRERLQSKHRETDAWESVIHLLGHPGSPGPSGNCPSGLGSSSFRIRQTHADVAFENEASQSQLAPTPSSPFSPEPSYSLLFSVCIRSWVFWMFTKLCSLLERSSCKDEVDRT